MVNKPISQHGNFVDTFNIGRYTDLKLEGDWYRLPRLFKMLGAKGNNQGIKRDITRAIRYFTDRYKRALVNGLASGGKSIGADWSHTPGYARSRRPHTVGVLNSVYLNSLNGLRLKQKKHMISLAFTQGALNRKSHSYGVNLGQYAIYFEKGTSKQKPRPLWSLAYRSIGGQKKLLQYIKGAVGKRLKTLAS